jgi:hypothetical protein
MPVYIIDQTGRFTCRNPKCENHGKVFETKPMCVSIQHVKGMDWKPDISEMQGHAI